jgi:DNA polymerase-3 subunit gamma/tau
MLALKYRPQRFSDVIGQKEVTIFLEHMTTNQSLPNLLIFDGVHGSGKTSSARIIGASVNCINPPVPCGECESCKDIFDGIGMSVIEIDAASHGKVADMEELRKQLLYSNGAEQTVVILDEAHAISREGFKSMLKTFEEAPPGVVFILVTTEFRKIPETIVSRAMRYTFNRVSIADINNRLNYINKEEKLGFDAELLLKFAEKANGSVRDAIMLMDKYSRVEITSLEKYVGSTGDKDIGPVLLTAMIAGGASAALAVVTEEMKHTGDAEIVPEALTTLFRDLLLIQAGSSLARQGEALEVRLRLAGLVSPTQIMNGLRVLWDLKTKIQHSEAYYEVYLAATMVSEVFGRTETITPKTVVAQTTPVTAKKMTLDELSKI